MPPICKSLFPLLGLNLLLWSLNISFSFAQQSSSSDRSTIPNEVGRKAYNTSCAGCHGLDGRGSDKAVDISGSVKVRHLSDAQLSSIISNGVPGTGMPAFRTLSEKQSRALVGYLRSLQGKFEARILPGNARRGKEIFVGKGECSRCHMIAGEGGFLGPDLSGYGVTASADAIRDEILRSQRMPPLGYRAAVLITSEGDRFEGMIRNEDNFSVQFQSKDGSFHFFQKSELRNLDRLETSLMPTDYRERLSPTEVSDVVSYLMSASPDASKAGTPRSRQDDLE
ncbi:MAG TPA: c-type cytochrome [Terriglobales bacterium]|nr:c-type cytochrome [Terriglobales bacterium]